MDSGIKFIFWLWAVTRHTDAFSVYSPRNQDFFPLPQAVNKRQVDQDDIPDVLEEPPCVAAMQACVAPPEVFIDQWFHDYRNGLPFRTDAGRVLIFCRNVAAARMCVQNVGQCEESHVQETLEHLNVCSDEGRAALIAIDGSVCRGRIRNDRLRYRCVEAVRATTTSNPTESSPEDGDDNGGVTTSESSYIQDEEDCREMHAYLDCTVQSYRRQCDAKVAHFIEMASRPRLYRSCPRA